MEILGYLALFAVFCGGLLFTIVGFVMLVEGVHAYKSRGDVVGIVLHFLGGVIAIMFGLLVALLPLS